MRIITVMGKKVARSNSTKDRHKKRHLVPVGPDLYEAMRVIAKKQNRPVSWQIRQVLEQAAIDEGLWPPAESKQ